jgi:hypothetical protein
MAALVCSLASCSEPTAPIKPPYLAIITQLSAMPGAPMPPLVTYYVRELSGTYPINDSLVRPPHDTIVIPVRPATYVVDLIDLPEACIIREGPQRAIVLSPDDNTGLVRYSVQCRNQLSVAILADGYDVDRDFLLRVRREGAVDASDERVFSAGPSDTVHVNGLAAGTYEIRLADVASNCVVTSGGGPVQSLALSASGGSAIEYRVRCSDPTQRPEVLSFVSGYAVGAGAFAVTAYDPQRDIDGYEWDLTDCRGNSVLPDRRPRTRRYVRAGRATVGDTVTVIGAYDVGLPDEDFRDRCATIRVFDFAGNSSPVITRPLRASGAAPVASTFNARLSGTSHITSALAVSDADSDIVGLFVGIRLRDGTLSQADGLPDLGVLDPAGFLGSRIPDIPTNSRIKWDDVYAVIVWMIDAGGNVLRLEDVDLFR